jgi:hypothetical protein
VPLVGTLAWRTTAYNGTIALFVIVSQELTCDAGACRPAMRGWSVCYAVAPGPAGSMLLAGSQAHTDLLLLICLVHLSRRRCAFPSPGASQVSTSAVSGRPATPENLFILHDVRLATLTTRLLVRAMVNSLNICQRGMLGRTILQAHVTRQRVWRPAAGRRLTAAMATSTASRPVAWIAGCEADLLSQPIRKVSPEPTGPTWGSLPLSGLKHGRPIAQSACEPLVCLWSVYALAPQPPGVLSVAAVQIVVPPLQS